MKKITLLLAYRLMIGILLSILIMVQNIYADHSLTNTTLDTRTLAMVNKPGVVLVQTVWTEILHYTNFRLSVDLKKI